MEEIVELHRKNLEASPDDLNALLGVGYCSYLLGRLADAAPPLEAAMRLAPDHHAVLYYNGRLLVAQGREQEAIPLLEGALKLKPKIPDYWLAYGNALRALGRRKEARDAYLEGMDHAFGVEEVYQELVDGRDSVL